MPLPLQSTQFFGQRQLVIDRALQRTHICCMRWMICLIGMCLTAGMLSAQGTPVQARITGLEQDVQELRRELGALRIEMEGLVRENQALRQTLRSQLSNAQDQYVTTNQLNAALRELRTQMETANNRQREAIISNVSGQVEKLAEQTQNAISALARSIEGRPRAPQQQVTFSDNYPKTGINYTVRPGDSLGRIAREQNSRVQWIRDANRLANDLIYPDQELFVPQQN